MHLSNRFPAEASRVAPACDSRRIFGRSSGSWSLGVHTPLRGSSGFEPDSHADEPASTEDSANLAQTLAGSGTIALTMAGEKPTRNRFLKLLRKTASRPSRSGARSAESDGALWTTHERAAASARLGGEASQRVAAALAKSRATVDGIADQARAASSRRDEIERAIGRLGDAFERLNLVALNAGLEGARLGETAGRSLNLVGDEIRGHVERGTAASRDVADLAREAARTAASIGMRLDEVRALSDEVASDASRVASAMTETERALAELSERLRKATGTDPETAKAIADATEHGRALVAALGTLTGRVPRAILVNALRPVLEPILRVVVEEDVEGEDGAT